MERKKISFYLHPDKSDADRTACEMINQIPQGDRGRVWRAALIAGLALAKQDARMPHLIAELLNESTTLDEIVQIMKTIFPEKIGELESELPIKSTTLAKSYAQNNTEVIPSSGPINVDGTAETRQNAQFLISGGDSD